MELNAFWRFFWHQKTWSSFIPTWTDHWKQMHRITTSVKYPRMVNQKSSCSQLTKPWQPLFGQKKCTKSEVEWFYGLHLWKRCPLPNVKGKKSTVHTKLILFLSQRCIRLIIFEHFQGIYTNKNRRHLWKPEWLQQNEFSSLEIPFGVPSVWNLGLKLPKPLLITATPLKNIFEGMSQKQSNWLHGKLHSKGRKFSFIAFHHGNVAIHFHQKLSGATLKNVQN